MSYTVFALKWRPQQFTDIIGQNHVVTTLTHAIERERFANAYLFAGPRGVGKTSCARIFAKALNCKEGPTANPCNKCSSCTEISNGRSFDVIEIDGASNTGVDNIRDLRESVKFAPTVGRFKVYIIDEVHMLSDSAFNALLKTLEEPPPYVKFIFATTHPNEIIPTILSRCQRFDFRRIPALEIMAQLQRITTHEKIEADKDVLLAIAKASDGSLRDAESVLDQLVAFSKGKISLKDVISVLGLVEQDLIFKITDMIINKDPKGTLAILDDIIDQGKDPRLFLNHLIEHFRNLMVAKIAQADTKLIDLPQEICEHLLQQAKLLTLEEIFATFTVLLNTQEMAKRLESTRIPLEIGLVRLSYGKKQEDVSPKADSPQQKTDVEGEAFKIKPEQAQPKENLRSPQAPRAQSDSDTYDAPALTATAVKNITIEEVKAAWKIIVGKISQVKISMATYLNEGLLVDVKYNMLTISFPRNYSLHKESLEKQLNRQIVEDKLSEYFDTSFKVNFVLSKEEAHREDVQDDTFIRSALETFDGRVITGPPANNEYIG